MAFEPKIPDYIGDGIAIWKAIDKDGNTYLNVKVLGGSNIKCFKNIPKLKVTTEKVGEI